MSGTGRILTVWTGLAVMAVALNCAAAETPRVQLGNGVAQANLISQMPPVYPPEAKAARIQGVVRLTVDIGADGRVEGISPISGPPALVESAVDAVRQWVYRPVLLNGEAVAITTTVDVNYTLSQ